MNSLIQRKGVSPSFVLMFLLALVLGGSKAEAQKKTSAPAAAPKAAAPAKSAATPKSTSGTKAGGASATHGPTTSGGSHGPTTSGGSHGPTTSGGANHPMTAGGSGTRAESAGAHNAGAGVPKGATTVHTKNGEITKRADGKPRDVHTSNGVNVHHSLDGHQRVEVQRGDAHIVAERGGRGGYIEHPYHYGNHEFAHRTYYSHGRAYDHYYGHYYYHGAYVNYYTPAYYYHPAFYGWAYNPWVAPVPYAWGWGGNPWYGYYGYYFTPYPVYASASLWLTDYMISVSLAAAYENAAAAAAAAQSGPPPDAAPLTPEVKQMISDEVQRQIALENQEAQTAQAAVPDASSSSIQRMLTDNMKHVFLVGHELDVVNSAGNECAVSQGDALQLVGPPPPDSQTASLLVLSSKGGIECRRNDTVSVQITDLQEMQNHMRETIDAGMGDLKTKQGTGGLPAMPASAKGEPVKASFMTDAPPPDANVSTELSQQYNAGMSAEQQTLAGSGTAAPAPVPAPAAPPAEPTQIAMGQSIDEVVAAMGQPVRIVDLTSKKIYVYKDMKITFKAGKVSDVQ